MQQESDLDDTKRTTGLHALRVNSTRPDQHSSPSSEYPVELSGHFYRSQPNQDKSPIGRSGVASVPNSGSAGHCKWCQRPFSVPGDLEEHERSTEPTQRPEGTWACLSTSKCHNIRTREKGSDASEMMSRTRGSSSPNDAANNGRGKSLAIDRGTAYTSGDSFKEEHVDVADTVKSRPYRRSVPLDGYIAKKKDQDDSDSDSENDDLGDLIGSQHSDAMASLYGTSMPKASYFGSLGHRSRPKGPIDFWKKGSPSFISPRSFQTAQSSLASYTTASSGSPPDWQIHTNRIGHSSTNNDFQDAHEELVGIVAPRVLSCVTTSAIGFSRKERTKFDNFIALGLSPIFQIALMDLRDLQLKEHISAYVHDLVGQLVAYKVSGVRHFDLDDEIRRFTLRNDITTDVLRFLEKRNQPRRVATTNKVFSSGWLEHLRNRGILLDPMEELDWSGKGQHVEYSPEDEKEIPLQTEKILGHSQTAIIDSVRCRRIRLARKKIAYSRRLKKEDAITEVEHLTKLQHAHIVRIVGTYTMRRDLAILLYPAAEWDLDAYMDEFSGHPDTFTSLEAETETATHTLITFFGCLSNAIAFIHERNVKHMDIKPKNILVNRRVDGSNKVYIADFGIARSYKSAADSETDSPVSFTRTYAAPEVVLQDRRGFSADIFSLGCVFMEMMATLRSLSTGTYDERQKLLALRQNNSGTSAYHANIGVVTKWYEDSIMTNFSSWKYGALGSQARIVDLCPQMISEESDLRPSYSKLKENTDDLSCLKCNAGPEPFEAAD
jgi:hypothetical protein